MKEIFLNSRKFRMMIASVVLVTMLLTFGVSAPSFAKETINETQVVEQVGFSGAEVLEYKFDKLKSEFAKNDLSLEEYFVFESVSDGKTQAMVGQANDKELTKAFDKVGKLLSKVVSIKKYNPIWVKVDVANDISDEISNEELNGLISKAGVKCFRKGILFENKGKTIALLEAELNANQIIDYQNKMINLSKLNDYIFLKGHKKLETLPDSYRTFTTISYFCDENDNIYPIYNDGTQTGRRVVEELSVEEARIVVKAATDYLVSQMQDDGRFVYGYFADSGSVISGYNNVRHSGTIWALVNCYDENASNSGECKDVIEKAIGYLMDNISKKSNDIYHAKYSNNRLCLGMDALSLIAVSEYTSKFNDNKYLDVCKKIGNGIIDLQQPDGHFYHIVRETDYKIVKEFSTVFYDGEAILGLCKLYGVTHDEKYLNAAKKAFDYCIENDYLRYNDHWLEYCSNEITKYTNEEKYFTFGLKNIESNLKRMKNKKNTSHTDFEKIMQGYELYKRIEDNNIPVEYLNEFPVKEFLKTLDARSKYQLNSFCYPEFVMYLKEPQKYLGAFYIRSDNFRIRIDDVQHSMTGFYYYSKNF